MKKNKRRIKKYDDNLTSESSFLHPKWSIAPQFVESNNGWVAITSPKVFFLFFPLFFIFHGTILGSFFIANESSSKLWKKGMMMVYDNMILKYLVFDSIWIMIFSKVLKLFVNWPSPWKTRKWVNFPDSNNSRNYIELSSNWKSSLYLYS